MKPTKEQLELVDKQVKRLVAGESYYGKMYREMGITEIKSEEDFYKLPFSSKEDLRNSRRIDKENTRENTRIREKNKEQESANEEISKIKMQNLVDTSLDIKEPRKKTKELSKGTSQEKIKEMPEDFLRKKEKIMKQINSYMDDEKRKRR